jgi:hypothetical protein
MKLAQGQTRPMRDKRKRVGPQRPVAPIPERSSRTNSTAASIAAAGLPARDPVDQGAAHNHAVGQAGDACDLARLSSMTNYRLHQSCAYQSLPILLAAHSLNSSMLTLGRVEFSAGEYIRTRIP